MRRGRVCRLTIAADLAGTVVRDSRPYFTVSDSRLPQTGGPGPRIYIPQKGDGPVTPTGIGFPFLRLL
jgi:hypothetical protein